MVEQCYNRRFPKHAEFRRLAVPSLLLCWGVLIFRAVPTWAVPPGHASGIDARQKRLENLEVKYDYSVDYNPPKGWGKSFLASAGGRNLAARGIKLGPPAHGIFRYHCEMSTLHGLIYFRQTIAKSAVPMASKYGITGSQILIYAPTRFESLTYPLDGGRPFGHITNPSDKLPPAVPQAVACRSYSTPWGCGRLTITRFTQMRLARWWCVPRAAVCCSLTGRRICTLTNGYLIFGTILLLHVMNYRFAVAADCTRNSLSFAQNSGL